MRRLFILLCALALSLTATTVTVDVAAKPTRSERAKARKHADTGLQQFKAGKYEEAIAEFRKAEEIVHAPPHLLYIARSLAKLSRLIEAREAYQAVLDEKLGPRTPRAFRRAQDNAKTELDALEKDIPTVVVEVSGAPPDAVQISIDGEAVDATALTEPIPLDPGEHTVRAEAEGYDTDEESLTLTAGAGAMQVALELIETKTEPDPIVEEEESDLDLTIPAAVVLAAGGASLVVGGITGALALDKASELRELCPVNPCPTEHESLADDANTLATVSTVTLIVGGVAAAAGAGWFIYDAAAGGGEEGDTASWRIRPILGPGYVGAHGAF